MWWSRRKLTSAVAALAAVPGCGFTPLYSEGSAAGDLRNAVAVEPGGTRFEFALRERLRTRLGVPDAPRYVLSVETRITEQGRAIRADRSILRFNLDGVAAFEIRKAGTSRRLFADDVRAFTAYSTVADPFATRSAAEDARLRLASALADQIVLRLAATARDWME